MYNISYYFCAPKIYDHIERIIHALRVRFSLVSLLLYCSTVNHRFEMRSKLELKAVASE